MSQRNDDAAYTELTPDSWHQNDEGNYYIECPECGSAATLMNVVKHGRCNGYLDQQEGETELDEEKFDCTAKLWFELGYTSDPDDEMTDDAVGESASDVEMEEGVPAEGSPPGTDGTVDDDQT
ncbi:hypothetical protein [Natronobacterium texcoconense]|uniref:Uncharacterized protein n=1 Tax=Natronobacterium texcoconense TaxID=1095778 RepID=A0A1H1I132_NATTX|nr:hypothetical protein [Natronobacterium texcoconense]SDR31415.1 hypothetical protein SAMN04489842_3223 [Natronobacterium texcoconense]